MGNELLRIASVLDKSGHYSLSDKLFVIAQNQNNLLSRMKKLFKPVINKTQETLSKGSNLFLANSGLQAPNVSDPMIQDFLKDAPVELAKILYSYGLEKLKSNEGVQGFINLITTKYGPKYDDFLSKLRNPSMRKFEKLPPKLDPKTGAMKLYTMGNNQAFEAFLQTTNKLSPNAKTMIRGLMQTTGKNLQNISKSLEGFANSPQAQLIGPAIEIAFNEFGKYLENPNDFSLETPGQKLYRDLNNKANEILADNKISNKRDYFLKEYGNYLKQMGSMEKKELLEKFPVMGFDQFQNISKNIGQK